MTRSLHDGAVSVTVPGDVRKFFAEDGILLRAEHLNGIVGYAETFTRLSRGLGPGVEYGFGVEVQGTALVVRPGLAWASGPGPLYLAEPVPIRLSELDRAEYWLIEVRPGVATPSGNEPKYGTTCAEAGDASTIHPWRTTAVELTVSPQTWRGQGELSRARLADWWFEQERAEPGWLRPAGPVTPLSANAWGGGAPESAPAGGSVPLGILLRQGEKWVVDPWIARRDVGDPPSQVVWEQRLGLRPRSVFFAQVLQFQNHLAGTQAVTPAGRPHISLDVLAGNIAVLEEVFQETNAVKMKSRGAPVVAELNAALQQTVSDPLSNQFAELPPAGFLPPPADLKEPVGLERWESYYSSYLGGEVLVVADYCRPDEALRAFRDAQHLDRIRLDDPTTTVRIHIPRSANESPSAIPWIVFTRGRAVESVGVFVPKEDAETQFRQVPVVQVGDLRFEAGRADRVRRADLGAVLPLRQTERVVYAVPRSADDLVITWRRAKTVALLIGAQLAMSTEPGAVPVPPGVEGIQGPAIVLLPPE